MRIIDDYRRARAIVALARAFYSTRFRLLAHLPPPSFCFVFVGRLGSSIIHSRPGGKQDKASGNNYPSLTAPMGYSGDTRGGGKTAYDVLPPKPMKK